MNTTIIENQNLDKLFIFSVYQDHLSEAKNETNLDIVSETLRRLSKPFKVVEGVYTHLDGRKVSERSILITGDNEDLVIKLCRDYNQESYLISTEDRESFLSFLDNKENLVHLGKLTEVSEFTAKNSEAYTYCPKINKYYICKK